MSRFQFSNIILIVYIFGVALGATSDELRVTLENGSKLIGRYLRSHNGRPIKAFLKIPYAKPPVGDLRFKAPEPIEKWDGEYKAIHNVPYCPQRNPFIRSKYVYGTEDCLYLNVYVPHTFDEKLSNLSVLVAIHGGGFVCGDSTTLTFGPEHFLDEDVILVTANYRVGPIGFLSSEEENCPGNFGLKDQIMFLKWVQENIRQFGGNPESVTIFGGSSGAVSVTYLMASPLAKGLFSKGIAQSGTNLASWSHPVRKGIARERAKKLAERFACYVPNNWSSTINCLRNVSALNITTSFYDFYEFDTDPKVIFPPVVEPDLPGAFITEHPRDIMAEQSRKIPFMTGVTFDEGAIKSAPILTLPGLFDNFTKNLEFALPLTFFYNHLDLSTQTYITNEIKEFYFKNELTRRKVENITNLFGDGWFLSPTDTYLRMRLANGEVSPTYVYLFEHRASTSFTEMVLGDPNTFYGISHGEELLFLYPLRDWVFPFSLPTREDEIMREAMIRLWVDFARTGNPTPDSSYLPKWDIVKEFPVNYYRIGNFHSQEKPMFGMESGGFFEDRTKFWREIGAMLPSYRNTKDEL